MTKVKFIPLKFIFFHFFLEFIKLVTNYFLFILLTIIKVHHFLPFFKITNLIKLNIYMNK